MLVALADLDSDGQEDSGAVTSAIAVADSLIDTYASKRFFVPFAAPLPEAIRWLSARLAVYALRRSKQALTAGDLAAHADDLKWLELLSNGEVLPGIEPIPGKGSIVRDRASARPSSKDVSRQKLKGFW